MVLRLLRLLVLIEHAGMENGLDALVNEPLDMTVRKLCRVALGFRRNGLHAQLVNLPGGEGRQHHPEAQLPEEGSPEGIIFVHVQHSGNADDAPLGLFFGQRRIIEEPLTLVEHQVGSLLLLIPAAGALFAPVAADVLPTTGELIHGEHTVVGAAAAAHRGGGIGQVQNIIQRQHGAFLAGVVASGNQSRAKSTHQAGDIRTGGVHPGDFLKGSKHRLIVESATLNHDVPTQILRGCQLDDLVQGIFDDGVGKTRGDIGDGGSLLLGLLDVGIHEHRAPGTQVYRSLGKESLLGKALGGKAQRGSKVLNKRAAAGGTGLVQEDGVHRAVFQLDALHVLTADVQHAVHLRVKEGRGGGMGNGLHHALVQGEGGLQQSLAVAGGAGTNNFRLFRQQPL